MATLKDLKKRQGPETASELIDLQEDNIKILDDNIRAVDGNAGDIDSIKQEVDDLKTNKQDKLTSVNAGDNITITEADGMVKINSAATIPDINGDNITATINGTNKKINVAIGANETAIANHAKLIANKADKSAIPDVSGLATKTELTNGLATKADKTEIPDVSTLATKDELKAGLADKANLHVDYLEYADDEASSATRMTVEDAFYTKSGVSKTHQDLKDLANKKVDKTDDTIDMVVNFKDGTTATYKVIKNA